MQISIRYFLFVLLVIFTSLVEGAIDSPNPSKHEFEERIYISSNDLLIVDNSLYLIQGEEIIPISVLFSDNIGLYIKDEFLGHSAQDACPNGHRIMHYVCNGCGNYSCIYRCRCSEEPFNKSSIKE